MGMDNASTFNPSYPFGCSGVIFNQFGDFYFHQPLLLPLQAEDYTANILP
jgi:hypothetical protein